MLAPHRLFGDDALLLDGATLRLLQWHLEEQHPRPFENVRDDIRRGQRERLAERVGRWAALVWAGRARAHAHGSWGRVCRKLVEMGINADGVPADGVPAATIERCAGDNAYAASGLLCNAACLH